MKLDNNTTIKDFLISDVLLANNKIISNETNEKLSILKKERTTIPVIYVGSGTCGIIAGAKKTITAIKNYLEENDINAELIETGCIGLCSSEPIVDIQLPGKARISFEKITEDKVAYLFDAVLNNIAPKELVLGQYTNNIWQPWEKIHTIHTLPYFARQMKVVLKNCGIINPYDINSYIANSGYRSFIKTLRSYTSKETCDIIEKSELRGRGGAGFLTGTKWKTALNSSSNPKYLVCNADESDPGAFMDRAIIEGDPHRLIEGMVIAAYAIGANKIYIYIRSEYGLAIERLNIAIKQAYEYGILGYNIFDSDTNIDIIVRYGAGAFVCGEETALINSLEGNRGTAKSKPPYPANSGLFNKPTVVNNVETLANIPTIIEFGPQWYNNIGTKSSKGTKVFALTGKTVHSGLIEVPMGTTIKSIIYDIAGGIKKHKQFKAVLIGGPSGGIITNENINIQIDFDSLKQVNAMMGSGGMVVMDEDTCMVDIAKFLINFLQRESCGKCIPCRQGTQRILEILENITRKPEKGGGNYHTLERFKGIMELEGLAEIIRDTSLCGLGQTAANPILTTLKYFREEYEEHIFDRKCRSGVCKDMRTFAINVESCTGCTICARKCPENAIIGTARNPHFIIDEKCIGCGICFESCKFGSITIK
ncbi:MAG: NADH-ubiquinone oxidoreductase-F iron-sulfur binding region domain-containing protein [Bacteroidota bacterium]